MGDEEVWKDIPGYEGAYQVSNFGRVRSVARMVRLFTRWGQEMERLSPSRILKPGSQTSGHLTVSLGSSNSKQVHGLVMAAFVGPRPEGKEVLHLDHNPSNNNLSNLRYGTRSENILMDFKDGRRPYQHYNFGKCGPRPC